MSGICPDCGYPDSFPGCGCSEYTLMLRAERERKERAARLKRLNNERQRAQKKDP